MQVVHSLPAQRYPPVAQGNQPPPAYPISPQTQVIYIQAPLYRPKIYNNYAFQTSKMLGIGRIVIGCLAILLQIIAIAIESGTYQMVVSFVGTGIWCGMFFILAGSFGVAAASRKTLHLITTNMVLAIISASIFGSTYLALGAAGVGMADDKYLPYYSNYSEYRGYKTRGGAIAMYALMLILAVTQCVFDIISSVLCCKAICCGQSSYPGQVIVPHNNAQVVHTNIPGGSVYPAQQAFPPPMQAETQAQAPFQYPMAGQPPEYTSVAPTDEKQGPSY